jgi:UDP-N-acetylglucosamine 4,6-dehydratase
MCPTDDSHLTIEFDDHFVIEPTIQFAQKVAFTTNALGEKGQHVEVGFEYRSDKNDDWLKASDLPS